MAAIRGRDTKPELVVRRLLHRLGFRYRLHARDLPGRPDVVFRSRRKVIFVHGCYWHVHSCRHGRVVPKTNAAFWSAKRAGNVRRDIDAAAKLADAGWRTLTVWECEVRDIDALRERLCAFLGDGPL